MACSLWYRLQDVTAGAERIPERAPCKWATVPRPWAPRGLNIATGPFKPPGLAGLTLALALPLLLVPALTLVLMLTAVLTVTLLLAVGNPNPNPTLDRKPRRARHPPFLQHHDGCMRDYQLDGGDAHRACAP